MSKRPPCERWVRILGPPKSQRRNLPRRPTRSSEEPISESGVGSTVFSAENWSAVAPRKTAPYSSASRRSERAWTSGSSGTLLL